MKLRYRIRHPLEEGFCDNCAQPMQVGDDGLEGDHGVYCSEPCWEDGESHNDGLMSLSADDYPD